MMKKKVIFITLASLLFCCHGDYMELGGGYVYANRTIGKEIGDGMSSVLIEMQVLNYSSDDNYIVAYQVPDDDYMSISENVLPKEKEDSIRILYDKMRKIHHCYWIVRKSDGMIFGPMEKKEFDRQCKVLNITVEMNPKYEMDFVR